MITFTKGDEIIVIDSNKITSSFSLEYKKVEGTYIVRIPSFDIHFYTKSKNQIEKSAHDSMSSFFNYWRNIQGEFEFFNHMLELGFRVKSGNALRKRTKSRLDTLNGEHKFITEDHFEFA